MRLAGGLEASRHFQKCEDLWLGRNGAVFQLRGLVSADGPMIASSYCSAEARFACRYSVCPVSLQNMTMQTESEDRFLNPDGEVGVEEHHIDFDVRGRAEHYDWCLRRTLWVAAVEGSTESHLPVKYVRVVFVALEVVEELEVGQVLAAVLALPLRPAASR